MFSSFQPNRLSQFFAGLAEFTFEARLGVVDPPLIDYITSLLTRFSFTDEIYAVKSPDGKPVDQVTEMLTLAHQESPANRAAIHRHIGDYTLFWSGLYPEALQHLQSAKRLDRFLDYPEQGKRAYLLASQVDSATTLPDPELLTRLSHEFDLCQAGLTELRREWQQRDDPELPPPLFR
jgi:hypothetical protein